MGSTARHPSKPDAERHPQPLLRKQRQGGRPKTPARPEALSFSWARTLRGVARTKLEPIGQKRTTLAPHPRKYGRPDALEERVLALRRGDPAEIRSQIECTAKVLGQRVADPNLYAGGLAPDWGSQPMSGEPLFARRRLGRRGSGRGNAALKPTKTKMRGPNEACNDRGERRGSRQGGGG